MPDAWCSPRVRRGCPCGQRPLGPATDARMVAELARSTAPADDRCPSRGAVPRDLLGSGPGHPGQPGRDRRGALSQPSRLAGSPCEPRPEPRCALDHRDQAAACPGCPETCAGLRLRAFDLRGGVDELELDLPVPDGTSRIHVVRQPGQRDAAASAGSAVRATIKGGIHELRFGSEHMRQVHGELRLETPGAGSGSRSLRGGDHGRRPVPDDHARLSGPRRAGAPSAAASAPADRGGSGTPPGSCRSTGTGPARRSWS